jgi:hypothetical protein
MAQIAIEGGALAASSSDAMCVTSAALSTLGTRIASAPELAMAATSASPHGVPMPLQRMTTSRLP